MTLTASTRAASWITLHEAIAALRTARHVVEEAEGRPGLYRVDDRPGLTSGQVIALAYEHGLMGGEQERVS